MIAKTTIKQRMETTTKKVKRPPTQHGFDTMYHP
jgi:hypothetical protein